jgi:hypothetical protein
MAGKPNQYDQDKECSLAGHQQKSFLRLSIVRKRTERLALSTRIACQSL